MTSQPQSEERVQLHTPQVFQFLEQVATQTVTSQEYQQRQYQRLCIARKKSLKKINNIEAVIRGKLQELQHERDLVQVYNQHLSQLERENLI